MPLPELTAPPGTPAFLAAGHAITRDSVYAHFQPRTGHSRKRRRYTAADAQVAVSWSLTAEQMAAVDAWAEDDLQAYNERFAARIANLGPGMAWYEAQWAEPYTATPDVLGWWKVTGRLWLFGQASVVPPVLSSLELDVSAALYATVAVDATALLELDIVVALLVPIGLALDIVVALRFVRDGAPASSVQFANRWTWQRLNYAPGRSADVDDTQANDQRSWFGI